jgi:hypothetical protein
LLKDGLITTSVITTRSLSALNGSTAYGGVLNGVGMDMVCGVSDLRSEVTLCSVGGVVSSNVMSEVTVCSVGDVVSSERSGDARCG